MEYIDCTRLWNAFPIRRHRLEGAFWALCAGGVDYCSGLSSFGMGEPACYTLLKGCLDASLDPMLQRAI